jgi:hypothetical protein
MAGFCFLETKRWETTILEEDTLKIAGNLKAAGLTNEPIQAATGLTDTDLKKL